MRYAVPRLFISPTACCGIALATGPGPATCSGVPISPRLFCRSFIATAAGSSASARHGVRPSSGLMLPSPARSSICPRRPEENSIAMTVLVAEAGTPGGRQNPPSAGFHVEFFLDWKQAATRWNDIGVSTPFQDPRWLDAWYRAFANFDSVEPLIVIISDAATSEQVALLPLIRRVQNGVRIIEFADLDLTDYNAPMLDGAAAPRDGRPAAAVWRRPPAAQK